MTKSILNKDILFYGFAIFCMFFGSGNLVFPLAIGYHAADAWIWGFLGLFLTGILLPFCGLFVIKFYNGQYASFFGEAGKVARITIPFFTLSLLGSFGVVPRCITVAHGGIDYILPELSLFWFAAIFSVLSFFACLKDHLMVKILGKWMSPILLTVLLVLIVGGIWQPSAPLSMSPSTLDAFETGFLKGYQMMDLFAAFFFSALVFTQIQTKLTTQNPSISSKEIFNFSLKSSLLASILLMIIYAGFVFLGGHYGALLTDVTPEHILPRLVYHLMGPSAAIFLALAMILSCLTTAVALNNIYARYICETLGLEARRFPFILFITTTISFSISLLDFKAIAGFLAPALEISYPALIFLTLSCIITRRYQTAKSVVFWIIVVYMTARTLFPNHVF